MFFFKEGLNNYCFEDSWRVFQKKSAVFETSKLLKVSELKKRGFQES